MIRNRKKMMRNCALALILAVSVPSLVSFAQEADIEEEELAAEEAAEQQLLTEGVALEMIEEERRLLDERRQRLDQEEARLDVARARIETDMQHLMALKEEVGEILALAEKRHSDDLDRLVNIYGNMRAKEAAAIIDIMDLGSAVEILSTLSERQAAPILEKMDRRKAQAVSRVILDRNRLPADRKLPDPP